MTKSDEIIQQLAPGNDIDIESLARVNEQLAQLRRAGTIPESSAAITRPLGTPSASVAVRGRGQVVFANSAPLVNAR